MNPTPKTCSMSGRISASFLGDYNLNQTALYNKSVTRDAIYTPILIFDFGFMALL